MFFACARPRLAEGKQQVGQPRALIPSRSNGLARRVRTLARRYQGPLRPKAASSGGGQAAAGRGKAAARAGSPSQTDAGRVGGREHGGDVTGVRGAVQGMRGRASIFFGPCQPNPSFSISEGGFSLSCIGNPAH